MTNARSPHRVVALAYNGLATFEFGIAVEVFGLPRPEMGPQWYQFAVASLEPSPLRATGGFQLQIDGSRALLEQADTVVIPGWRGVDEPVPDELCALLVSLHQRGVRLVALCSGAFVLAAAGLLDQRPATTHWRYLDCLRQRYPAARVQADVLYVGTDNVFCSAGSAAALDLCLHLVAADFGLDIANQVAQRLVVTPHRSGGAPQRIIAPIAMPHEAARLNATLNWMQSHLPEPQPLAMLAARTHMSPRTFLRRFQAQTGLTPARWLLNARLQLATARLAQPGVSLAEVAYSSGFASSHALRRELVRLTGMTPTQWKKLQRHE